MWSHPFIERLIGTVRGECLDQTLFWTTADLEAKLNEFQKYFNEHRTHAGIKGRLPGCWRPTATDRFEFVWMAEALSRLVPDSDWRPILGIRQRQALGLIR